MGTSADIEVMRRIASLSCAVAVLALAGTAAAQTASRSWAAPQIAAVIGAGLMGPSASEFRPQDPLTRGELAIVLGALGAPDVSLDDPDRLVTIRELDAQLVSLVGLRPDARTIRQAALDAGLAPTPWLGTETVARLLGLRTNHVQANEELELQVSQPATRAEAAFSIARVLALGPTEVDEVRRLAVTFALPEFTEPQRIVLARALRLVGSPYVWAGTSERRQQIGGRVLPGGFDCSGLVWRVYKTEPLSGSGALSTALRGRTSYAMSGEVSRSARVRRANLEPGDVVFFGSDGPRSKPSQVGHMGIYVGNGWMVHSSRFGTTLQPMVGWYETSFAWGRNLFRETGILGESQSLVGSGGIATRA